MANKIRIYFPYVEAGTGHIMPMHAFVDAFKKKYGDEFEIIESNFYKDESDADLLRYEQSFCNAVRRFARFPVLGHICCFLTDFSLIRFCNWAIMRFYGHKSFKKCMEKMAEQNADVVFSTHWATNYYAKLLKLKRPLTIVYCPDCRLNRLFEYPSDLTIIPTEIGYKKGLQRFWRFNPNNLKQSNFLIRKEAFSIPMDRYENRRLLGLPENKFTIVMMEGGYGIGKTKALCERLAKSDLKITIVAACGKNTENLEHLKQLKTKENVTIVPLGFTDKALNYIAACDLFIGKGGNSIAEPTFFGRTSIVSTTSTIIEENIAKFYCHDVGCAIRCTHTEKILTYIQDFVEHPEKLKPYEEAAMNDHPRYDAGPVADLVYQFIKESLIDKKKNNL